jgi:hypothetical protein
VNKPFRILSLAIALLALSKANATTILPTDPMAGAGPYDLGEFAAGTYLITGTGVVDLAGGTFQILPDGTPASTVTTPGYGYFNPSGSFIADGLTGPGGNTIKIGALMGTLDLTPTSPADWFLIGYSTTVTLSSRGHIYAAVNDTYYPNDTGSFTVTVTEVGSSVPDATGLGTLLISLVAMACLRLRVSRTHER